MRRSGSVFRNVIAGGYLLLPAALSSAWVLALSFGGLSPQYAAAGAVYFLTAAALVCYVIFKPCAPWVLPAGFVLSPLPIYLYELPSKGECNAFLITAIAAVAYSLPMFLISMVILAVTLKPRRTPFTR